MKEDIYADDLIEETGYLFEELAYRHYDMNKVVPIFMKSHFRESQDGRHPVETTRLGWEMLEMFEKEFEPYKLDFLQYDVSQSKWVGELYTCLQTYTGISSTDLVTKYEFSDLYARSKGLHDFDPYYATYKLVDCLGIKERSGYDLLDWGYINNQQRIGDKYV